MAHNAVPTATLADAPEIGDSPLMRAMSSELIDAETLACLVAIANDEASLD